MSYSTKIPRLKLNVSRILDKAEALPETLTYESNNEGTAYVAGKEEILVFTSRKGYLRLRIEEARQMMVEIGNIIEDMERW